MSNKSKNKGASVPIRFDEEDKEFLRKEAEERGLKLSPFIRMILKEHIRKQKLKYKRGE